MLAAYSRVAFPLFSVILPSTEGEIVRASNDTIDRRCDRSCSIVESRSASAVEDHPRWPLGWSISLRLLWRFSSSLAADREATIGPNVFVARLFSDASSSPGLHLFSLTTGLSLCLGGVGLACCYCGRAKGGEGAGLEEPA